MNVDQRILAATGATDLRRMQHIQLVWSGWGEVVRYELVNGPVRTVVVKHVSSRGEHRPRGGSSSIGEARKRRSYEVEAAFYRTIVSGPRRPHAYLADADLFVLEDLDAAGFSRRHGMNTVPEQAVDQGLRWLAEFHAAHLGHSGDDLWPTGTYWHLATRPDEWATMEPGPLKDAASAIDAGLRGAVHQTLVHGDAKVANFCFGDEGTAAVDFQYAGVGPGIVDVVYFLGSCFGDSELERNGDRLIERYFTLLNDARCPRRKSQPSPRGPRWPVHSRSGGANMPASSLNLRTVSDEWSALVPFAWADFERFLAGWAPEHHKRGSYAARQTLQALRHL